MTPDIRWSVQASIDLGAIDEYYAVIDPDIADRVTRAAVDAANFLADWPKAGTELDQRPRRKWRVKDSPYVIVYRPYLDHIAVLRVRHTSEDWR